MYANLYLEGKLPLDKLITKRYSLDNINQALDDLEQNEVVPAYSNRHYAGHTTMSDVPSQDKQIVAEIQKLVGGGKQVVFVSGNFKQFILPSPPSPFCCRMW